MKTMIPHPAFPAFCSSLQLKMSVLVVLACLPLLAGCGKGLPATGDVTGKVIVGGKAVSGINKVAFIGADGKILKMSPTMGGNYGMTEVPVGTVRITVRGTAQQPGAQLPKPSNPADPGADMNNNMPDMTSGVSIPAKYANPDNGLTYTVTTGQQTHNIELTP